MLSDGRAAGEKSGCPELADVFRRHGESYQRTHRLSACQQKVMRAVAVCRTQELGGHLDRCDACGFERPAYNSCRNRHCPKCQSLAKDQTLKDHFHLHCLVPAGALSFDQSRWISAPKSFLFPVKALSRVFRGKFLALLKQSIDRGKIAPANNPIQASRKNNWVVYAKEPFGSPRTVLDYLGRYTHRVAFSNDRILQVEKGEVTLSYRDRRDRDRKKTMTLDAQEFIRRFLLHVLPDGFMRIRHFGFLANRSKKQDLAQCRRLLDLDPALPKSPILSAKDRLAKITGVDLSRCPYCHVGTMVVVGDLPALSSLPRWDSS